MPVPGNPERFTCPGAGDEEQAQFAQQILAMLLSIHLLRCHRAAHRYDTVVHADHGHASEFEALHPVHGADSDAVTGSRRRAAEHGRREAGPLQALSDVLAQLNEPHGDADLVRRDIGLGPFLDLCHQVGDLLGLGAGATGPRRRPVECRPIAVE